MRINVSVVVKLKGEVRGCVERYEITNEDLQEVICKKIYNHYSCPPEEIKINEFEIENIIP